MQKCSAGDRDQSSAERCGHVGLRMYSYPRFDVQWSRRRPGRRCPDLRICILDLHLRLLNQPIPAARTLYSGAHVSSADLTMEMSGQDIVPLTRPIRSRLRSAVAIPSFSQILNELVQNSVDAGATRIECWINLEKGNEIIRVEDNGHGLDRDGLNYIGRASGKSMVLTLATDMADWQSPAKIARILNLGPLRLMALEGKVCDRIN